MSGLLPLALLRILALVVIFGVLAMLILIFSSSSLILEKRKNRILERQLEQSAVQVSQLNSLERQLEESALMLYRMQALLIGGSEFPDSLLSDQALNELRNSEIAWNDEEPLAHGEQQVLRSLPNAWPLRGWVTREFNGIHGPDYHPGMDIAAELGDPVRAAGDGVVLVAGWSDQFGNFVLLDHGFGVTSLYGHNSTVGVRKEDRVERGDILAYVGTTGHSTAPHVHFEIRRNGIPEDPRRYLLE